MQHRQQLLCLFLFLLCLCRQDHTYKQQLVTMLQYAILQVPVFLTELLVVINIESNSRHSWTAIFTPLYILSFLSIAACILSCCIKVFTVEVEMKLNIIYVFVLNFYSTCFCFCSLKCWPLLTYCSCFSLEFNLMVLSIGHGR